jgi:hypothetical protein
MSLKTMGSYPGRLFTIFFLEKTPNNSPGKCASSMRGKLGIVVFAQIRLDIACHGV